MAALADLVENTSRRYERLRVFRVDGGQHRLCRPTQCQCELVERRTVVRDALVDRGGVQGAVGFRWKWRHGQLAFVDGQQVGGFDQNDGISPDCLPLLDRKSVV